MTRYEEALLMAVKAHAGQRRMSGEPYVCHTIRVAARVGAALHDKMPSEDIETHKIVGLLHDTIEDTSITHKNIADKFDTIIADAVQTLSRNEEESYEDFVARCEKNPIALRVKIADLEDNTSDLPKGDKRWNRYRPALARLRQFLENQV